METGDSPLFILYGSATGNAEHIAKDLAASYEQMLGNPDAYTYFPSVICCELDQFKKKCLPIWEEKRDTKCGVLIITSTTGNGDAPENASRFVRFIKRKTSVDAQSFRNCNYAVLGLGDTNYDVFCACAKDVDRKVQELGGTRIRPLACGDEGTGCLEDVVDPWVGNILMAITNSCRGSNDALSCPIQDEKKMDEGAIELKKSVSPLFILYGSATGNAESIAKDLAKSYDKLLLNQKKNPLFFDSVICCELGMFKKECQSYWEQEPLEGTKHGILLVASTTGNGDAPENASRFTRYIKRKTTLETLPFRHCAFAVLGLGDTNYDIYCACSKEIDKKMGELGGTRIKPITCADEGTGMMEETVDPWVASILLEINQACSGQACPLDTTKPTESQVETPVIADVDTECKSSGWLATCTLLGHDSTKLMKNVNAEASANLNTCRLVCEEELNGAVTQNGNHKAGQTEFTQLNPCKSEVTSARYLTQTPQDAAQAIHDSFPSGVKSLTHRIEASSITESRFPIADDEAAATNGKRVIELTCRLPDDSSYTYTPGDALGLIVENPAESVEFVLNMLKENHGMDREQLLSINGAGSVTLESAVSRHVDLSSALKNKRLVKALAVHATDMAERGALLALTAPESKTAFHEYIELQRRTIVDLLREFPSCQKITAEELIGMLPSIPVRYYSVCSSPLRDATQLSIAFSVVDYMTPSLLVDNKEHGKRRIGGVATRYLETAASSLLCGATKTPWTLNIFPKPNPSFHPPSKDTPLILIGPGTGIAPFLGFLWQRQMEPSAASVDVFFGCRHRDHDYLYQTELEDMATRGVITNLYTAFSRDGNQYVQDILQTRARESFVTAVVEGGAHVYLCGDGNQMARDVQDAIASVLADAMDGAPEYFERMKAEGRFRLDVWT